MSASSLKSLRFLRNNLTPTEALQPRSHLVNEYHWTSDRVIFRASGEPWDPFVGNIDSDPVMKAVILWHEQVDPWMQLKMRRGLRALRDRPALVWGSLFSGSDVFLRFIRKLERYWSRFLDKIPPSVAAFQCEANAQKQEFLSEQHGDCQFMFAEVASLLEVRVRELKWGGFHPVPSVEAVSAGFSCASRSKANSASAGNVGCVQKGTEKTGLTFQYLLNFIKRRLPKIILLENLEELSAGGEESDTNFVLDELRKLGYTVEAVLIDATKYGSRARHVRLFFVALRAVPQPSLKLNLFKSALSDMEIKSKPFSLDDFLCADEALLQLEWEGPFPRIPSAKEGCSYQDHHEDEFIRNKWQYPPSDALLAEELGSNLSPLYQREKEVCFILNRLFPMGKDIEVAGPSSRISILKFVTAPVLLELWAVEG